MESDPSPHDDIRRITGNALSNVLFCPKCYPSRLPNVKDLSEHFEYSWAVTINCSVCSCQWNICKLCKQMRKPMLDSNSLYQHNYRKHRRSTSPELKKQRTNESDTDDESSPFILDNVTEMSEDTWKNVLLKKCLPGDATFDHFQGNNNSNYFRMQHRGNLGAAYLVGWSNFKLSNVAAEIEPKEVSMHLSIATLTCTMTRGQRTQLATILDHVAETAVRQHCAKAEDKAWATKIPRTPADMRSLYVEGKHAILPNLPRPGVTIVDDHAYVSLKDCVADLLGHGFELDSIEVDCCSEDAVTTISQTAMARRILSNVSVAHQQSESILCLYLTEWSDGFEPASSKSSRQSCWIKTVTIAAPPTQLHSLTHTYPIALGIDGVDHEKVEERFAAELQEFRHGKNVTFYHGGVKQNVIVYLEVFVSLQDQPERRSANFIMLGGSTFTARWGMAFDLAAVASGVPACSYCLNALMRGDKGNERRPCRNCVNWDTDLSNGLLEFTPPENFPTEHIPPSGKLSPLKLTYDVMKGAVTTAHEGFVTRGWTKKNVDSYLRVHGLNKEALMTIMNCAINCKEYSDAVRLAATPGGAVERNNLREIEARRDDNPELFERWMFPSLWDRGVQLDQHIDVAMHLIFLGVVKTCIGMVQDWTKKRGKHAAFLRYVKGALEPIQQLGLDWCRCVPYRTGKLGGWVSENYLGVTRLLDWLYCSINEIASDEVFETPLRHQRLWNVKQNRGWLSIRGLDTKGTADTLRQRVREFMDQQGGPPAVLPPQGGAVSNVFDVVSTLKAMVARLMKRSLNDNDIKDADRHIKLFLTAFENFDSAMRTSEEKPTWITSYNFICLTNFPNMLRQYGPIRNLWEGGGQGEKIIGLLKPLWFGYRSNWHKNLLTNLLKRMAIDRVQMNRATSSPKLNSIDTTLLYNLDSISTVVSEEIDGDEEEDDGEEITVTQKVSGKMAHRYKNLQSLLSDFENRKPLSVVRLRNGRFGCILRDNRVIILRCNDYVDSQAGACYHNWALMQQTTEQLTALEQICNYCLLLPKMTSTGMPSSINNPTYTLIESDWMDIQQDRTIATPKIPGASYLT